jgi:aryl-alcohol dehydrogenase-like predicted oxidoreductase
METAAAFDTQPKLTPREIGTTGIRVFPVAFDGCVLGWVTGFDRAVEVLDTFRSLGGNLIVTADHYAGGRSEHMIGSWLVNVPRASVVIASKVGRHPDHRGLGRKAIPEALNASLDRLQTDYIDLLSLDGDLLGNDPIAALEVGAQLVAEGRVRQLSLSHADGAATRKLQAAAEAAGVSFSAVLAEYNLMTRKPMERDLGPVVSELQLGFFARLPLAAGFLSGEVRSRTDLPANPLFDGALEHVGRRGFKVLEAVETMAAQLETTASAVALSWLLSKPLVTAAVVRLNNLDALADGLSGASIQLSRSQIASLDAASQ